ncbi:hypothetical protein [Rhodanobacter sp. B05]|uniref:hypothetical protein n=1 Tax=Rhodanobacter sp. B05 TaxID=1945859 RepID=UPI0020C20DA6|nr:hypothetical protein [Rhodanobacter sp. B05]
MRRRKPMRHRVLPLIVIAAALTTGCHPAMSTQPSKIQPPPETLAVPLRFASHNFAAHCYNTIGCQVIYNGRYQQEDGADQVAPPPPSPKYRKELWDSVEIDIHNFPPPAEVRWKSLDGVQHEAKVDMAAIFKDKLIWHKVPKSDMADFFSGPVAGDPSIFLEVNDHTINVYTKMFIPTRTEQIPGNKDSNFRNDLFLVWTHAY